MISPKVWERWDDLDYFEKEAWSLYVSGNHKEGRAGQWGMSLEAADRLLAAFPEIEKIVERE